MSNTPTTQEPETAQPPQFSLLSLMLFVTVVGLYLGSVRRIPQNFYYDYPFVYLSVYLFGLVTWCLYSDYVKSSGFSVMCFGFSFIGAILFSLCELAIWSGDNTSDKVVRHYWAWSLIFFMSLAAISSIIQSKKQTGSWYPWVGKRAEGESDE